MKPDRLEFDLKDFEPSLAEVVASKDLRADRLTVGCVGGPPALALPRENVMLSDGQHLAEWNAPPLQSLFRGRQPAPSDMKSYPPEYVPLFAFIEEHVLLVSGTLGMKTDGEFEDWYSNLRRRPDGRSLGEFHDHLWRVLALLLAARPTSVAEYEAVVGRLAQSARAFRMGHSTRNYIDHLKQMFSQG